MCITKVKQNNPFLELTKIEIKFKVKFEKNNFITTHHRKSSSVHLHGVGCFVTM